VPTSYRIVQIDEQSWRRLRDVRLAALQADPSGFGSTLERELDFGEDRWRNWPRTSACFLVTPTTADPVTTSASAAEPPEPGPAVGLAVGKDSQDGTEAELNALWVAPEYRGSGLGAELVKAVMESARASGKRRLTLWVTTGNSAAIEVYERLGFLRTGAAKPLPSDPQLTEVEYARPLG